MSVKNKISVIVPCYNVEKYVAKCLDSIINQTYSNLEILVVEDCSPDNTLSILKEYEKKDKRIKVIKNKKNGGLSFSRNAGIKESTGEYLSFIDSDDYIDQNFYEVLMDAIESNKADIAVCDIKVVYEEDGSISLSQCYSNHDFNLANVVNNGLAASACNKLFKKDLITKYLFEVGKVNEDIAVVIPALINAKKIAYGKDVYYYYLQRKGSIQNSGFSDKRFDIFYGVGQTLERIKDCKEYAEYREMLAYNQLIVLLLFVVPKEKKFFKRRGILKKFYSLSKEYDVLNNKYLKEYIANCGKKHRIYFKLFFNLMYKRLFFLANCCISFYNGLNSILRTPVIKKNINLNTVIKAAKHQSKMKDDDIKISVVVPNYNYEEFLYQRIYSILSQKVKIYELIILDDNSSDNSRKVIDGLVNCLSEYIDVSKIYNTKNSGSAFKQWQKGFELAKGDYVWITEADDYCSNKFLKEVVKPIRKNNDIVISYADTAFVDKQGSIFMYTIKKEIDIMNTGHWDHDYVIDGMEEINKYAFLNCTIANVSAAIIKKDNYHDFFKQSGDYKQVGDYLFYFNVMTRGKVAFRAKALNYYRVHGNNVTSTTKKQAHFDELVRVHEYIDSVIHFNEKQKKELRKRYTYLSKVWGLKIK